MAVPRRRQQAEQIDLLAAVADLCRHRLERSARPPMFPGTRYRLTLEAIDDGRTITVPAWWLPRTARRTIGVRGYEWVTIAPDGTPTIT